MPTIDLGKVIGPPGPQGATGADGAQGIQGPPGQDATINGLPAITITPGPNVELNQEGSALEIGAVVPGKQMLINWDFRKPVNRNGQTKYAEIKDIYTIDLWFKQKNIAVSITQYGISLVPNSTSNTDTNFRQRVASERLTENQKYTFSVLTSNNLISLTFIFSKNMMADIYEYFGENQYLRIHYHSDLKAIDCSIFNRTGLGGSELLLTAAKLELGDHQTLARQNEDGEWEIIDPPNYDLQYLLCSQYSPSTGEWVGSQHSNPNLLRNAYFTPVYDKDGVMIFPINQRGQTEYTGNSNYCIDGWKLHAGNTTFNVEASTITTHANTNWCGLIQTIENFSFFKGKTLTFSLLCSTDTDFWLRMTYGSGTSSHFYVLIPAGSSGCYSVTGVIPQNATILNVQIVKRYADTSDGAITLVAAKLELGPVQTLAHKEGDTWVLNDPPPDPALERLKCQRYYRVYATSSARPSKALDCCPVMRINPTQTTITIDDVTYYINDANL